MIEFNKSVSSFFITAGFVVANCFASVWAADGNVISIEAARFDPVEMHFGDMSKVEFVPKERLGEMPVPILEEAGNGFLKIPLPEGGEGWVNRNDVRIGGVRVEPICAQDRKVTRASDSGSAHLRGISRNCD
tara:strand:- start:1907 stop:2302 length:396 start_codon:yes stop_codon:yes gene_type:complete